MINKDFWLFFGALIATKIIVIKIAKNIITVTIKGIKNKNGITFSLFIILP